MHHFDDTIAALATPAGSGALAIIRISGSETYRIVQNIFRGPKSIASCAGRTIQYGTIVDNHGEVVDDVLLLLFRAPHSFTGEDSIEISTHGSQYIVQRVMELLMFHGARPAEPGEFTRRAFLNGKLDLSQAEAVVDVIQSRTEASLRGARNQLDGLLSKHITGLRDQLITT